jgi:DNA-directed RNA polymerase beta' subunit
LNLHVPQTLLAQADIQNLMTVDNNFMNAQDGTPLQKIIQDAMIGSYLLTKDKVWVTRDNFFQFLMKFERDPSHYISRIPLSSWKRNKKGDKIVSGKLVFSVILPPSFYFNEMDVLIEDGILKKGTITKSSISKIITIIYQLYGKECVTHFLNNVQFLANDFLLVRGFSVGYRDCLLSDSLLHHHDDGKKESFLREKKESFLREKKESFSEEYLRKKKEINKRVGDSFVEADMMWKTLESVPMIQEAKVSNALNKVKDISHKIAKESMMENNNLVEMIVSGSKGNYSNVCQISGILGQQYLTGKRMAKTLSEGKRTISAFPMDFSSKKYEPYANDFEFQRMKYESSGFVSSSFLEGLNPVEFFFHSTSSREGLIDTSVKTSDAGYLSRKVVKFAEDTRVEYQGGVRYGKDSLISFTYHSDGLAGESVNKKGEFVNMQSLVGKIISEMNSEMNSEMKE